MFMCLPHWRMLPKTFQNDIWANYRPGQEIRKDPTNEYIKATQAARLIVAMREKGFSLQEISSALLGMREAGRTE